MTEVQKQVEQMFAKMSAGPSLSTFTAVIQGMQMLYAAADYKGAGFLLVSHRRLAREATWEEAQSVDATNFLLDLVTAQEADEVCCLLKPGLNVLTSCRRLLTLGYTWTSSTSLRLICKASWPNLR